MKLYSEEILRRSRQSFPIGSIDVIEHEYKASNPICGDSVQWKLKTDQNRLMQFSVQARGCALCKASASLLSEKLLQCSIDDIVQRIRFFESDVEGMEKGMLSQSEAMIFEGLKMAPARKDCVLLAWRSLYYLLINIEAK